MNIENTEIKSLIALIVTALILLSGFVAPTTSHAASPKSYVDNDHKRKNVMHHGPVRQANTKRVRNHRNVTIVRSHGHFYHGYGHYNNDDDAYPWLAFTAITLKVLDNLNEKQQREHEAAQVEATNSKVGETIEWIEADASGSVTVVREGTSTSGRYCREFQQEITVAGNTESAYGTACMQPDGSWEIVSTGS